MRHIIQVLLIFCLLSLLISCGSYSTRNEGYDLSHSTLSTSSDDFNNIYYDQKIEIADAIVDYLHKQHPSMPKDFPFLSVTSVKISDEMVKSMKLNDSERRIIERTLSDIFKRVEDGLFPERSVAGYPSWKAHLVISSYTSVVSNADKVAMGVAVLPASALCWGTVFIACPGKTSKIYSVEITAFPPEGGVVRAIGAGSSDLYISSILMEERGMSKEEYQQNLNALVAATANAANRWIDEWKKQQ
jgi:hypothetical protein